MPKLFYQGHGSLRLTANDGRVIYIDPFAGEGYDLPADIILVSHDHFDHNQTDLCAKKENCQIITKENFQLVTESNQLNLNGIKIMAVDAYNKNHLPSKSAGFIITIDGVKVYVSGDTSKTAQMATFADMGLVYAILCGDGFYNMGPEEAAECAEIIRAKHNIIYHVKPKFLFDREIAEKWTVPNKLIVEPNEEIEL